MVSGLADTTVSHDESWLFLVLGRSLERADMTARMRAGILQANGETVPEPVMDVADVARTVRHMAELPLEANVQFATVLATTMPYVGRG